MRFLDRVALIGGAAGGIGRAVARRLAAEGAHIAAVDLDASVDEVAAEVHKMGQRSIHIQADLSRAASGEDVVARTVAQFGRVDIVINCTGTWAVSPAAQATEELWDHVIDTDLKSCFNLLRPAVRAMIQRKSGRLLTISSRSAMGGDGQVLHAAAKAGVIGFTKTLALEVGRFSMTVNAISPFYIDTPAWRAHDESALERAKTATAVRRVGTPDDVAAAAAFLVSDEAGFITGQVLSVCGGSNLGMLQW